MKNIETVYSLAKILGCKAKYDESMANHTTFKIGGNAPLYIEVNKPSQLSQIVKLCNEENVEYFILGNGSNLLVSDKGVDYVVICLKGDFKNISLLDNNTLYCGAGASLAALCREAEKNGLSGLEFAWGIPGTVGGAAYMNAGAYGGEMKDVVYSVHHIDKEGNLGTIKSSDLNFSYRHSIYKENGYIIIGITVKLKLDNKNEIRNKMDDFMDRRKSKQPLEYPSAGSVFKRPDGNYAGTLIEQCGLKGKTIGGAQVSEKHAGFIINIGGATCNDVQQLIEHIQSTVKEKTGYILEREIIFLN
ncbi:MAG: UDP-N-acetylmuramate dehydrogenase [Oscillospiraceae bacterium]|nr:UDP-N-acetylmuramate dehydrogenase [Oscillospiraceae bacterium]